MLKNNLRVWGVWDRVISRIEYLSESQSSCRQIMHLFQTSGRTGLELLRFDLCPLYYDNGISRAVPLLAQDGRRGFFCGFPHKGIDKKTNTNTKTNKTKEGKK